MTDVLVTAAPFELLPFAIVVNGDVADEGESCGIVTVGMFKARGAFVEEPAEALFTSEYACPGYAY